MHAGFITPGSSSRPPMGTIRDVFEPHLARNLYPQFAELLSKILLLRLLYSSSRQIFASDQPQVVVLS